MQRAYCVKCSRRAAAAAVVLQPRYNVTIHRMPAESRGLTRARERYFEISKQDGFADGTGTVIALPIRVFSVNAVVASLFRRHVRVSRTSHQTHLRVKSRRRVATCLANGETRGRTVWWRYSRARVAVSDRRFDNRCMIDIRFFIAFPSIANAREKRKDTPLSARLHLRLHKRAHFSCIVRHVLASLVSHRFRDSCFLRDVTIFPSKLYMVLLGNL